MIEQINDNDIALSKIGKITSKTYLNVKNKEKILSPHRFKGNKESIVDFLKRNKYQNIEGDYSYQKNENEKDKNDLEDSEIDETEDEIDIFDNKNDEGEVKQVKKKKMKKKISIEQTKKIINFMIIMLIILKKRKKLQHQIAQNMCQIRKLYGNELQFV